MSSSIGSRTAESSTGSSSSSQVRRLACNRCRNQKLRCERAEGASSYGGGDDEACRRCRKANIACHTSPPRRMGRPKHAQQNMSFHGAGGGAETTTFALDLLSSVNIQQPLPSTFPLQNTPITDDDPMQLPGSAPFADPLDLEFALEKSAGDGLFAFPHLHHPPYAAAALHDATPSNRADIREDYIEKLSTLSASLLKQLRRMQEGETSPKTTTSSTPASETGALIAPKGPSYPVGAILRSTQQFLAILKHFVLSSAHRHAAGPASPGQYRSPVSEMDDAETPSPLPLNLPTAMAIFTCYISLVRVYRQVFTRIHQAIRAAATSLPDLPAVLPPIHWDGLDLSRHRSLQITILLRVSLALLGRIERAVAALAGGRTSADPVAARWMDVAGAYAPLLQLVVQQDADGAGDDDFPADVTHAGGVASLTRLAGTIQQALDDDMCLQLQEADLPL